MGLMNCPKCSYDMWHIYGEVCECNKKSKCCKIIDVHDTPCDTISGMGTDWIVKCTCPKCGTKFSFSDSDY